VRTLDALHELIVLDGKGVDGTAWPTPGCDGWWPGLVELYDEQRLKMSFMGVTKDVRDESEQNNTGGPYATLVSILAEFIAAADKADAAAQQPPPRAPPPTTRGPPPAKTPSTPEQRPLSLRELVVATQNMRGIRDRAPHVGWLLDDTRAHALVLTETHLDTLSQRKWVQRNLRGMRALFSSRKHEPRADSLDAPKAQESF